MSSYNQKNLERKLEVRMNKLLSKKRFAWDLEITHNIQFPNEKELRINEDDFIQFLKKLHWLWNLQFYYSIKVIKLQKRARLVYFLRMYVTTQNEVTRLLYDMYYDLNPKEQQLVYDYIDVPRLEKEIDGISTVLTKQWNEPKEVLTDKEMLGLVEEVGDSVKDPVKKVFGKVGNWITDKFSRYDLETSEERKSRHVKEQGKINSGIKYMDEFANIGMRMARGGL